jgi:heterodisulfide reductase subunit A-like polyferredoxin
VEGEPGHFTTVVHQQPRFVDLSKCTSCGDCEKVCPVELKNEYDESLGMRRAIFKKYAQAIPGTYAIQKTDKAPCHLACPAGLNVQGYVQMVKQGKYQRALEIIMEDLPLPGVLGRVCPHGCEDACRRCEVDSPVAIRDLKRLAADQFDPRQIKIECLPTRSEKVAIIGSGPAGLSTAYFLARRGIRSTIFEALPEAGGMLRVGIPDHRLPREVLDREIEIITQLGVEIKTHTPLGPDLSIDDLLKDYQSVYLAIGAHKGIELGIPGERVNGVVQGVRFLKELNLTGNTVVGKKVGIIGGGNVAIDVARSAVRLGAEKVSIIYRRTRKEMPAFAEEIEAAIQEGVEITYLAAPQEVITRDGRVDGLRCIRMELGEADSSGRRTPIPIPGSEFELEIDQLIPAIGQKPDLSALEDITGLEISRWGTVEVNAVSYATDVDGVFAGGDLQTGPWTVIGAIAAGKEAAESIVRFLDGQDMTEGREPKHNDNPVYRPVDADEPVQSRARMPELPLEKRRGNFNEVELGYDEGDGRAEAARCLNCSYCCECEECVPVCLANAIDHSEQPQQKSIEVGAVILTGGTDVYDPNDLDELYLYKRNPNVITSIEFERILSATGPTEGHLQRPSDQAEPKRIAWLQCVGSRDTNQCDNGYCSSVCCMYAIKEAVIAKEHSHNGLECTIFNMDIRTFGKDYEKYFERAKAGGVRFVRSRVHTITEDPNSRNLTLKYVTESGEIRAEEFDMVVLSVGMEPSKSAVALASDLGIELNEYHFVKTDEIAPVNTSRPGFYVAGVLQGPKDIPYSIMEGSAAACSAGCTLSAARGTLVSEPTFPDEIDITGQEPRIGVFVCNCGINIGGIADVPALTKFADQLPNVVYAESNLFSCSQDTQQKMVEVIKEKKLNRVVVAACSPITHEPLFQETLKNAGLNPFLFEMANIRNQCTWVHSNDKDKATAKAKDLIRMSVARSSLLEQLAYLSVGVNNPVLVIGGGIAGMTAALNLADQGFPTTLVEKTAQLGGAARNITQTWKGEDVQAFLVGLVDKVEKHPKVDVLTNAEVVGANGFIGNFETTVAVNGDNRLIQHGAVIVATGGQATDTQAYLYGQNPRVSRWHDLEQNLRKFDNVNSIVFIQCVGSRDDDRPYCSKICCTASISQALAIKEQHPDMKITILHRDIRTYGDREAVYQKAREAGILFIRYSRDRLPVVNAVGDTLEVGVFDPILQRDLIIEADLINLATAIEPSDNTKVTAAYKLPVNAEKFIMEAHAKLRPVDCVTDGVFVCGLAHYPKPIGEAITQAQAAVSRATSVLTKATVEVEPIVSEVNTDLCIGCGLCEQSCCFSAIRLKKVEGLGFRAETISALCKGCGVCSVSCPQQAINMRHFKHEQIMAAIRAGIAAS